MPDLLNLLLIMPTWQAWPFMRVKISYIKLLNKAHLSNNVKATCGSYLIIDNSLLLSNDAFVRISKS